MRNTQIIRSTKDSNVQNLYYLNINIATNKLNKTLECIKCFFCKKIASSKVS